MSKTYQQIGEFQKKFRDYFVKRLTDSGFDPDVLIEESRNRESKQLEFLDFKNFIIRNREVFRVDFGHKVNSLPTWLDDLREIRNKVAHFAGLTSEEEKEAEILIKKISGFAGITVDTVVPQLAENKVGTNTESDDRSSSQRMKDPALDSLIQGFPLLSKDSKYNEYKVRREDLGAGSMWIRKQRDGYRLVTTGNAHCVDGELERLTGCAPKTFNDRNHCSWKSLDLETVRKIFQFYSAF